MHSIPTSIYNPRYNQPLHRSGCKPKSIETCIISEIDEIENVNCGNKFVSNAVFNRLIHKYKVKYHGVNKNYFLGRFHKEAQFYSTNRKLGGACMQLEGLQGMQLTEEMKEKYNSMDAGCMMTYIGQQL